MSNKAWCSLRMYLLLSRRAGWAAIGSFLAFGSLLAGALPPARRQIIPRSRRT